MAFTIIGFSLFADRIGYKLDPDRRVSVARQLRPA